MKTAWAHLPNAVHIDRVLASLNVNLEVWNKKIDLTSAQNSWCEMHNMVWNKGRSMEMLEAGAPTRYAAWHAITTLVACDDCAYMLDSDPGELAIIAAFGDHRAILLLPACRIFSEEKMILTRSRRI